MKVYTNNQFEGMWDVGTAAVVVAPSKAEAVKLLKEKLEPIGLGKDVCEEQFYELETKHGFALVLRDGNY